MQTNSTTTNSAAQNAATVANAVKNEAAKRFGEEAAAKLVVGTIPTPQAAPQGKPEADEKPKRTRKTEAPKEEAKPETAEQRAARMQKELQTTLQKLTKLQDLNKKRTKFIFTMDLLTDAKQKLTAEEDFEAKSYKLDFCRGENFRDDRLFSIANRELLLDFVDFMQSKIQERVSSLEAQIIEV